MSRRLLFVAVAASIALSACGGSSEKKAAGSQASATTVPAASGTEQTATSTSTAPSTPATTAPATATTAAAPTTTSSKPAITITKAAYVTQANSICRTMNNKMAALADPGDDLDKLVAMLNQTHQIMTETLTKLRALPVPAGQEAALTAIWAKVDVIVIGVENALAAFQAGNLDKAMTLLEQLDVDTATANAASIAYGLTVCGE